MKLAERAQQEDGPTQTIAATVLYKSSILMPSLSIGRLLALAPGLCLSAGWASAQAAPATPKAAAAPSAAASAPEPAKTQVPAAPAAPAAPATPAAPVPGAAPTQQVEITGGRQSDTEQRRRSTAAKIIIGREEIDKFGDATLGEVLRRLPGVTTPGAPGRGGPPRMRGLGSGFTQLLIDGQPAPRGFNVEDLTPEQVERIEVQRAPTAETGARAIAGTINIITREGFRMRRNDVRLGLGVEDGQRSNGLNWSYNNSAGDLTYNLNASLFKRHRKNESWVATEVQDLADLGTLKLQEARRFESTGLDERFGTNLSARLQWRLNDRGDSLVLSPSIFHTENHGDTRFSLIQPERRPGITPTFYDTGNTVNDGRFTVGRMGTSWRQRVGDVRLELNGNGSLWRADTDSQRSEFVNGSAPPLRVLTDSGSTREKTLNLTLKASGAAGGGFSSAPSRPPAGGAGRSASAPGGVAAAAGQGPGAGTGTGTGARPPAATGAPSNEHNFVAGLELETSARDESRVSVPDLADFGDNLKASSLRVAAYGQDEWQLSPNWGVHAGLRWEGIRTQGDSATGERPDNRSSVWTPLLHGVWKPDPKSRDQVRISLTRSYRSPPLGSLIARPTINRDYPAADTNIETAPDSAGNADLKPELATGIDLALERYLEAGGVLSANLFHRQISNLIRGRTQLEDVSWSPVQRYVRRQRNIGDATTSGIELEAKFRLDQLIPQAPRVEMRSNLSLFHSSVKAVPGPDNRLDEQAKATANIGADYRMRGIPLSLGGNVNWVPGYSTRLEADQVVKVSTKQVWDAYALWTFSPAVTLRLLGSNLDPRDYIRTTTNDGINPLSQRDERTVVRNNSSSAINWQLRLELKL